jgi:hypothetical protein
LSHHSHQQKKVITYVEGDEVWIFCWLLVRKNLFGLIAFCFSPRPMSNLHIFFAISLGFQGSALRLAGVVAFFNHIWANSSISIISWSKLTVFDRNGFAEWWTCPSTAVQHCQNPPWLNNKWSLFLCFLYIFFAKNIQKHIFTVTFGCGTWNAGESNSKCRVWWSKGSVLRSGEAVFYIVDTMVYCFPFPLMISNWGNVIPVGTSLLPETSKGRHCPAWPWTYGKVTLGQPRVDSGHHNPKTQSQDDVVHTSRGCQALANWPAGHHTYP